MKNIKDERRCQRQGVVTRPGGQTSRLALSLLASPLTSGLLLLSSSPAPSPPPRLAPFWLLAMRLRLLRQLLWVACTWSTRSTRSSTCRQAQDGAQARL